MKLVSDATKLAVNSIEPATIANHGYLHQIKSTSDGAKHDEFTCPNCGNGSGESRTGITVKQGSDGHYGYFCHVCGEKFDNVHIIALRHGLDSQRDFRDVVKVACDEFGIYFDDDDEETNVYSVKRSVKKSTLPAQIQPPQKSEADKIRDEKKLKLIRDDLNTDPAPLKEKFPQWRGLPADFLIKYGCRFIEEWTSPDSRADNKFSTPTPRMIIPAGNGYLARLTCSVEDFPEKARPYIKEKQHAGKKALFNRASLEEEIVFAVEGEVDAMSIEFVGFHACAVGGAGSYDLLVDAVKNLQKNPRLIVILFDGDKTGRDSAAKLHAALNQIACPSVVKFLAGDDDSKIDANDFLRGGDGDSLKEILQKFIDDAMEEAAAFEEKISFQKPFDDDDRAFYFSGDCETLTNARRLEKFCSDRVKFVTDIDSWLIWQDSGVWRRCGSDKNHFVLPFVFELADRLTLSLPPVGDGLNKRKAAMNITKQFKDFKKFSPCISTFKGLSSIRITAADLDTYPNLLCVQNGVVDLQTGKLFDADPSLLLTQQCSAAYDPTAQSPLIDKFFRDIMPDEQTCRGLLRWLGYCLTGEVSEEKFLIWLGQSGANGKGSLSRTLAELLNDYASVLAQDALVIHKFDTAHGHTASLNPIVGARFSISEELAQNSVVNSALIKTLVGGDMLTFRALRQEAKTYTPTSKINIASNFTPKFENIDDGGIERRALIMPFSQTFKGDRADPHLKKKLLLPENLRGFLNLLVGEARAWYKDGLVISDEMTTATRDSLAENDWLADFLDEFCELGTGELPRRKLLDFIREKCIQAHRFNDREICKMLEKRGIGYRKSRKGFIFTGIRLCSDTDRDFGGEPLEPDDLPPGI